MRIELKDRSLFVLCFAHFLIMYIYIFVCNDSIRLLSPGHIFNPSQREINQISRDILRAVLLSESVILSDSGFGEPGNGTCLGSSPNCPLVASFRA